MIDAFVRDLHLLRKADALIGKLWVKDLARRFGFFVFAGLVAVFGLGMTNVAGFCAFQESVGPVWAALIIAVVDFALALVVILVAGKAGPGSDLELALENRKMAIEAIQADASSLKLAIDALGQDVRAIKDNIAAFMHNPLDVATQTLLIPAATAIITSLRAKKDEA